VALLDYIQTIYKYSVLNGTTRVFLWLKPRVIMDKKILSVVIILVILLGVYSYVTFDFAPASTDALKVGVIGVLSGPAATSWGIDTQRGIEFAVEDAGELGINIEIIVADSEAQPSIGVSEFKRINSLSSPDLFIVESSAVASAIKPLVNDVNKPIFFTAVAVDDITKGSPLLFRNFYLCSVESPLLAKSAINKLDLKKTVVLFQKEPFGESCSKFFIDEFEKMGGEVVLIDDFLIGATDFKTILLKTKNVDFDSIYISSYELSLAALFETMKELNINKKVFSTTLAYSPTIRKNVSENTEPFQVFFSGTEFYLESEKAISFGKRFKAKYGTEPSHVAAYSYDSMMMIALAKQIADEKSISLEQALLEVEFEGINGLIKLDVDREVQNPVYLLAINKEGKAVEVN
jgi:branched-chain amino acid transport system substrate-binding protein